jgi:hypothetical protein
MCAATRETCLIGLTGKSGKVWLFSNVFQNSPVGQNYT